MKTQILRTDLVHIYQTPTGYEVMIRLEKGGWIRHQPFPPDLRGRVGAMQLATDVLAGKFWPQSVVVSPDQDHEVPGAIDFKMKQLLNIPDGDEGGAS